MFSESKTLQFLLPANNNATRKVFFRFTLRNSSAPIDVDYDAKTQEIYWTDYFYKTISAEGLQGGGWRQLVRGLSGPAGLAVDWVSNLLYFTDEILEVVGVASSNGRFVMTLFDTDLTRPRSIALDPQNGLENKPDPTDTGV